MRWNEHRYKLEFAKSNCIDFIAGVAQTAGIRYVPPHPPGQIPEVYVKLLKAAYEKQVEDDHREAEAAKIEAARKQAKIDEAKKHELPGCLTGVTTWRTVVEPVAGATYTLAFQDDFLHVSRSADSTTWDFTRSGAQWTGVNRTPANQVLNPISCTEIDWNNGRYKLIRLR